MTSLPPPHQSSLCMSRKIIGYRTSFEKKARHQHLSLGVNAVTARPLPWEFLPLEQTVCFQRRPSIAIVSPLLLFIRVSKWQLGSIERFQGGTY